MKVKIGPYTTWIGPYQIAEKILFWRDKNTDESVHNFGEKLASIDWLVNLCQWIESKKKRKIKVHIDDYDVWSLDHTLAVIILPALKELKKDNTGHPCGLDPIADVSEFGNCGKCGCEQKWDEILDKMIWSFKQIVEDDEESHDNYKEYNERIQEGIELFGKYYRTLWT